MRNLITILILFVAFGCGKSLKEEDVVGSYEWDILKFVLLENGKFEAWTDGEKEEEGTWKFEAKDVHTGNAHSSEVFKIESNGDLTMIAVFLDGKRTDFPKETQTTWKRIK